MSRVHVRNLDGDPAWEISVSDKMPWHSSGERTVYVFEINSDAKADADACVAAKVSMDSLRSALQNSLDRGENAYGGCSIYCWMDAVSRLRALVSIDDRRRGRPRAHTY